MFLNHVRKSLDLISAKVLRVCLFNLNEERLLQLYSNTFLDIQFATLKWDELFSYHTRKETIA